LRCLSKSIYILYHNGGRLVNHFLIKNQFNRLKIEYEADGTALLTNMIFFNDRLILLLAGIVMG
jgi:hypothetical protein